VGSVGVTAAAVSSKNHPTPSSRPPARTVKIATIRSTAKCIVIANITNQLLASYARLTQPCLGDGGAHIHRVVEIVIRVIPTAHIVGCGVVSGHIMVWLWVVVRKIGAVQAGGVISDALSSRFG
jgi:hypothetical protein